MSDLVSELINSCIASGKSSVTDICQKAQDKIEELEKEISIIESTRQGLVSKQNSFRMLIQQFTNSKKVDILNFNCKFTDLNPYLQKTCITICELIENYPSGLSSKDIMEKISLKEHKAILTSIKWLWDAKIIERNDNKQMIPGKNWNNKPVNNVK